MRNFILYFLVVVLLALGAIFWFRSFFHESTVFYVEPVGTHLWEFQSIDTMKYSRDVAKEKADDLSYDAVIDEQVKNIANTGATHIAIATPYDEEFIPFLSRWIVAARREHLNVWFRGNFSGWEQWFGYTPISRDEHIAKTRAFILEHPDLFEDGDAFTACPECENGGPGDPRQTGDIIGHRTFLVSEYDVANESFVKIGRKVVTNYFSMNGDVARLVMDHETTRRLGGTVTIDHYVATPQKLAADIRDIARRSGGDIVLGEFGAPIPDIHGRFSPEEQSRWIDAALQEISEIPELVGVNYWLSVGGSTAIWDDDGEERPAVGVLETFFYPDVFFGRIRDEFGYPVENVLVRTGNRETLSNTDGYFEIDIPRDEQVGLFVFSKNGFRKQSLSLRPGSEVVATLVKERKTKKEAFLLRLKSIFADS